MERLYVFLIRNDVWIYIICALGLLWYLNELFRGQGTASRAMFGLERETALRTRNKALILVVIFSAIVAVVVYVNTNIRPDLPPELLRPPTPAVRNGLAPATAPTIQTEVLPDEPPSPTSPLAATVTLFSATSSPLTTTQVATATIETTGTVDIPSPAELPEPALTPTTAETTVSSQPSGGAPNAIITEPREDASILGLLNVFGSANTDDFSYYEIEIRGPQTNERWASLVGRRILQPVSNGILAGNVNLSAWTSGQYEIRLSIINQTGEITHQCHVSIILRSAVPGSDP